MNCIPSWLSHGSPFLAHWLLDSMVAVTLALGMGWLILSRVKSPLRRQRLGEGLLLATILLAILAAIPGIRPWSLGFISPTTLSASGKAIAVKTLHIGLLRHFGGQPATGISTLRPSKKKPWAIADTIHTLHQRITSAIGILRQWLPPMALVQCTYCLGVLFSAGRLIFGSWLLRRFVRKSTAPGPELAHRWNAIVHSTTTTPPRFSRIVRPAKLLLSADIDSPISFGVIGAYVLLPAALVEQSGDLTIDAVLHHEFAHIDRRDTLSKLLTALAGLVYFYHPLVRWLNRQVGRDREFIADAIAARESGGAFHYAQHLITLARACGGSRTVPFAVGMLTRRSELSERVSRLLNPAAMPMRACSPQWLASCAAFLLTVTVGLSLCTLRARGMQAGQMSPRLASTSASNRIASIRLHQCRQRGVAFLLRHQRDNGAWLGRYGPAVTALATKALLQDGIHAGAAPVRHALEFIESCRHADGGFYGDSERRYNTAIVLRTLASLPGTRFARQLIAARKFLQGHQRTKDQAMVAWFMGSQPRKPPAPDWTLTPAQSDTGHKLRTAIRIAERWDASDGMQSIPPVGNRAPQSNIPNAGNVLDAHERRAGSHLRTYGNITYAQLRSMIYAGLTAHDARVLRLRQWLRRHYTLAENPAEGSRRGLFYYYLTLASVLHASHQRVFTDFHGRRHDWSRELLRRLSKMQRPNGSWRNSSNRSWLEGNQIMATTYAVLTLEELQH